MQVIYDDEFIDRCNHLSIPKSISKKVGYKMINTYQGRKSKAEKKKGRIVIDVQRAAKPTYQGFKLCLNERLTAPEIVKSCC